VVAPTVIRPLKSGKRDGAFLAGENVQERMEHLAPLHQLLCIRNKTLKSTEHITKLDLRSKQASFQKYLLSFVLIAIKQLHNVITMKTMKNL
jgi:hypothetical protein